MTIRKLNNNLNVISSNLKNFRKKSNLSQAGLARKLNLLGIPVHKNDIQRIESNNRTVRDYELWGFVIALDIDFKDLFIDINSKLEDEI